MPRSNSPEALRKLGYAIQAVKEWRAKEHEAGRRSGLDDFYRAHGICVECGGHGNLVTGVRWRDSKGVVQAEEGPIAVLRQRHNLENPVNWLTEKLKWDYLYEACSVCGGTGRRRAEPQRRVNKNRKAH